MCSDPAICIICRCLSSQENPLVCLNAKTWLCSDCEFLSKLAGAYAAKKTHWSVVRDEDGNRQLHTIAPLTYD